MDFWQKLRADFPSTKSLIYLDHASASPIPLPIYEKIQQYYREHHEAGDTQWPKWLSRREEIRQKAAGYIGASDPSEIAFISSTSQGMNYAADLLAEQGEVLTNESEFPASTLPWIWRGTKMIWQKPEAGKISLPKLKSLLSPKVKTIVTSYVQYATGFRQDLATLGKIKGGRFLVVNATQGFGSLPINVEKWNADFLMTNAHKWFMSGYGAGIFYIRKKWLKKFRPSIVSWQSMNRPELMDNRRIDPKNQASRYEIGCPDFPSIFAFGAGLDYFLSIGMEKIEKRILDLTDYLIEGLEKRGFEVVTSKVRKERAGIVVFKINNAPLVCKKLLGKKIYVSPRGAGIRVAPHFYNSFEEIEVFLKTLYNSCRSGGSHA